MIDGQKSERLQHLRLYGGRPYRDQRFTWENGRTLRNGVDIACETEVPQIVEELLSEHPFGTEELDIGIIEMQLPDVADELFQSCRDGESSVVRHLPEEDVEVHHTVL